MPVAVVARPALSAATSREVPKEAKDGSAIDAPSPRRNRRRLTPAGYPAIGECTPLVMIVESLIGRVGRTRGARGREVCRIDRRGEAALAERSGFDDPRDQGRGAAV